MRLDTPGPLSPLTTWFAGAGAEARFRGRLGRLATVLPPRDRTWREVAPGFAGALALAAAGSPFHTALEQRYDRSSDRRRLPGALAAGESVYFPQAHQVLPRVARLMVALRVAFLGAAREETSFLFLAEGRGREALGLHHDGEVDAFWLQLEGRRFVTIGPAVPPGTPEDFLADEAAARALGSGPVPRGWWRGVLTPGTLFYLPPRTPHRVLYRGRSLALSLTWKRRARPARVDPAALVDWDVVAGRADRLPPARRDRLWAQVPAVADALCAGAKDFTLHVPGGALRLPARAHAAARWLGTMPSWRGVTVARRAGILAALIEHGLLAPRDLPLRILPEDPRALDGWRFA
jgi:cupin superfamily protein